MEISVRALFKLSYVAWCEVLYFTYIYTFPTFSNNVAASFMYQIISVKTENISIDKIWEMICSHLPVRAYTDYLS